MLCIGSNKRRDTTGAREHISHSRDALFESQTENALASEAPTFDPGCLELRPLSPLFSECNLDIGDAVSKVFNEKQRAQADIQKPARIYKYGEEAAATYMPGDTPDSMRQSYIERQEEELQEWMNIEWESATDVSQVAGDTECEEVELQSQQASSKSGSQHSGFALGSSPRESEEMRLWTKDDYCRALRVRGVDSEKRGDDKMRRLLQIFGNARSQPSTEWAIGLHANDSRLQDSQAKIETVLRCNVLQIIFQCCPPEGIYDWHAKSAWSQPRETQLPSTSDDRIALPRPEIALFFTRLSFTEKDDSAPIPEDLESCMFPDGIDRCFPFLFVELEKTTSDLDFASLVNLRSATQALYNIYHWMARAGMEDVFFKHIRVLSIAVSARECRIRLHRSSPNSDGSIAFHFDELLQQSEDTIGDLSQRLNAFLSHFVPGELHRILRKAYDEVVLREERRVQWKRRARGDPQPRKRVCIPERTDHLTKRPLFDQCESEHRAGRERALRNTQDVAMNRNGT